MITLDRELFFRTDTKQRKGRFTSVSFSHPAKMSLPLQLWLILRYSKPGDLILDCMAGSGTILVACALGRDVIALELELKFCRMMAGFECDGLIHEPEIQKDTPCKLKFPHLPHRFTGNWEKIKLVGPEMGFSFGKALILHGDARHLSELLDGQVNQIFTSPPYESSIIDGNENFEGIRKIRGDRASQKEKFRAIQFGEVTTAYGRSSITKPALIVTSPPYEQSLTDGHTKGRTDGTTFGYTDIGNLPYRPIDSAIFSPLTQREGKVELSAVYIAFFKMDCPIALLLKTYISPSILSTLTIGTMPKISVNFDNRSTRRNKKVNKVFPNLVLSYEFKTLFGEILGKLAFKAGETSFPVTFYGTKDAPVSFEAVWLNIEGLAAKSAFALYTGCPMDVDALTRAINTDSSLNLVGGSRKTVTANRADTNNTSLFPIEITQSRAINIISLRWCPDALFATSGADNNHSGLLTAFVDTEFRAVETTAVFQFRLVDGKLFTTIKTTSNNCSTHQSPMSVIPQKQVISAAIFSPPFTESVSGQGVDPKIAGSGKTRGRGVNSFGDTWQGYAPSSTNIGNLKSTSYLEAMLLVYQECFKVLKPGGNMVLVLKNFIRNKQIVRLDLETLKLCESVGFVYQERWYRRLPAQSFWRIIALLKCDERRGNKQNPKCKIGLLCPIKPEAQAKLIMSVQEDNRDMEIKRVEKLCPSYKNTSPQLFFEDVLVFVKPDVQKVLDER